ncbi:MAG: hypothetical protein A3C58_01780 [Candidatus Staskawiczbacteria bacterium RIFCSPHIGHO2_02_FULL_34_10]|uniref:ComEC/Rec2-related protein domain-containing protein n=2 Tax=Candidatus Staskawicziibacteriota TaxID=1817916 RepID=A0A1G2HL18_9BACT|nr:MAG: hypothetical protein A2639_03065 [Candidatus Staskawiczbacteria bacterium RIFCSPHIGHO2_01_FULL_34_27]OGZ67706.1 MAG: hypothetical protein A3C58_01780 [Candidatus Staskawiczbacteria bacterium RIFCSPHIGHO2_02_FULL_34_10]
MTPSKALFCLCIFFIIGIFISSIIRIPQIYIWGILFLGVLIMIILFVIPDNRRPSIMGKHQNNIFIFYFCILFLILGIMRVQISEFNILNDKLSQLNDAPEKVTLTGQIIAEPDIRDTLSKIKIRTESLKIEDAYHKSDGRQIYGMRPGSIILVTLQRYPEYQYLDTVKITGKLKTPAVFEDFDYKSYLMKDGIYSVMDFPKIELISQKHDYNAGSFLYEKILFLKDKLIDSINMNFSPPNSDILKGVVFGNDKSMSKDLKDKFSKTGLSHITAVSGSNIVIVISIITAFLLALRLWRQQASILAIFFIWIYIVLIGFPVSGVRAAIMGSLVLLAGVLGRQNTSSRILFLTASIMLLQNPLLLFYDISFQLSFLASMGIIYLKPLIDIFLGFNKKTEESSELKKKFKLLFDIISVTLAAQIFTLPIIVYNFGTLSLISPITNILVLPIIPLLTILGFLVSIFGVFSNILGFIFSLPCIALLTYVIKVLEVFSQPWAVKTFKNISWIWLVIYYFVLAILIWYLNKKQKPKFLGY